MIGVTGAIGGTTPAGPRRAACANRKESRVSSSTRRRPRTVVAGGLLAGVLAGGAALGGCAAGGPSTAATVGGQQITSAQLAAAVSQLQTDQASASSGSASSADWLPSGAATTQQSLLQQMIDDKVLRQVAARDGITWTAADIDNERAMLEEHSSLTSLTPGRIALQQALVKSGIPVNGPLADDLVVDQYIYGQLLARAAQGAKPTTDQLVSALKPGDKLMKAYVMYTKDAATATQVQQQLQHDPSQWAELFAKYHVTDGAMVMTGASVADTAETEAELQRTGGYDGVKELSSSIPDGDVELQAPNAVIYLKDLPLDQAGPWLDVQYYRQQQDVGQRFVSEINSVEQKLDITVNHRYGTWDPANLQVGQVASALVDFPQPASPSGGTLSLPTAQPTAP